MQNVVKCIASYLGRGGYINRVYFDQTKTGYLVWERDNNLSRQYFPADQYDKALACFKERCAARGLRDEAFNELMAEYSRAA